MVTPPSTAIVRRPSPNHDARPAGAVIDMLVLHYTDMADAAAALDRLCDPQAKVSAHYLIAKDGTVYSLVEEGRRAWHAGEAYWRGARDINARSIGIELDNPGHGLGLAPFPAAQMAALVALAGAILGRHPIPPRNVVGHSDVAPRRKRDPGELFDWRALAAAGIGQWPAAAARVAPDAEAAGRLLAVIGYEDVDRTATVTAFQRRYRPAPIDGRLDAQTMGLIAAVARRVEGGEAGPTSGA